MNPGYVKPIAQCACGNRIYHQGDDKTPTCTWCKHPKLKKEESNGEEEV